MSEIYKRFCPGYKELRFHNQETYEYTEDCIDMSEKALEEMYQWESFGKGDLRRGVFKTKEGKFNGYAVGKQFMDYMITDLKASRHLFPPIDLVRQYPVWWLLKTGLVTEENIEALK
jgi:hypothetical protein